MISRRTALLLIALLILAIYANSFGNEFVWDDAYLIVKNPSIMSWNFAWVHFAIDLYQSFSNYYRPIQMITYMIDFSFWRLNPFGYHLTNVVLHILVSFSIFMLFKIITQDARVAFIGSLLYAVHPAHTAAVTYIAGRADSLAALFSVLSLILLHRHFKAQKNNAALFFYIGSLFCFLLALLSKEIAIVLPAIMLCYRLFFIRNDEVEKSRKTIIFHYLSLFIVVLCVYSLLRMNALNFQEMGIVITPHSLYSRLLTSLKAIGIYFGIIFLPLNLHMERSIPYVNTFFEYDLLVSAVLIFFIISLVARIGKISKPALFGFLFFSISLIPVMNIYPLTSNMAEHWLYIPMIGMSLFVTSLAVRIWDEKEKSRPVLAFLMVCLLTFFSYKTVVRNFDWRDEFTIYNHTFNYNPKSIKVLNNLGNLYNEGGNRQMAIAFHKKAVNLNPAGYKTRLNLGIDYESMDMLDEALTQYELSARLNPDYAKAYFNMGNLYLKKGKVNMAIIAYRQAVRSDELHIPAHTNLGNIYFEAGDFEKAKGEYEKVIEINPYLPEAHNNLGSVLSKIGLYKEAIEEYKKAIEFAPEEAEYRLNLGTIYGELSMFDEAIIELDRAYQLNPGDVEILINRGVAYYYKGNIDVAQKEWEKALLVDPTNPIAIKYLGDVFPPTP